MYSLKDKLAVITGGASGIGLETAKLFARQGASLALADVSSNVHEVAKKIKEQYGDIGISSHICDVTSQEQVDSLFKEIKEKHNGAIPTIVVNSAGIATPVPFLNMSESVFDKTIDVNLKGTFLVSQTAAKLLVENFNNITFQNSIQSYASIINLASQSGKHGLPLLSHYSATKAGVEGLTRAIAKELGSYRIRVNAILPYYIETPMTDPLMNDERKEKLSSLVALKRLGKPEEVAELILFLASDSSSYITGSSIDINGGF